MPKTSKGNRRIPDMSIDDADLNDVSDIFD